MIKNHSFIYKEQFPELMLSTDWDSESITSLVNDYLSWQAPILLTLAHLSDKTRKTLEVFAEQRPEIVEKFYRFYPKVIDTILLNKILVEARMRNALTSN